MLMIWTAARTLTRTYVTALIVRKLLALTPKVLRATAWAALAVLVALALHLGWNALAAQAQPAPAPITHSAPKLPATWKWQREAVQFDHMYRSIPERTTRPSNTWLVDRR